MESRFDRGLKLAEGKVANGEVVASENEGSAFRMVNVGAKTPTMRRAVAQGRLFAKRETIDAIRNRELPKGDALAMAEVAGIMAAKRTPELLPLCHPLLIDAVRVDCKPEETSVLVNCEVSVFAKTGVEMEALSGVMGALLCIYDLTKIIDPELSIADVHLRIKEGGKSGRWVHPIFAEGAHHIEQEAPDASLSFVRAGVITASDRCSKGTAKDESGPAIVNFLVARKVTVVETSLLPDDKDLIKAATLKCANELELDLVVITGGTGIGPRDVTPEALKEICTKPVPGISELLRLRGSTKTPMAWLSRFEAGLVKRTLVIALPGSPKAVVESMDALAGILPHALKMARGGSH